MEVINCFAPAETHLAEISPLAIKPTEKKRTIKYLSVAQAPSRFYGGVDVITERECNIPVVEMSERASIMVKYEGALWLLGCVCVRT